MCTMRMYVPCTQICLSDAPQNVCRLQGFPMNRQKCLLSACHLKPWQNFWFQGGIHQACVNWMVKTCFASGSLSSCVTLHQFPSRLVAFSQHFEPLEQVINAPFHTVFPCKTCNFQAGEEQTFQGALKSPYALA